MTHQVTDMVFKIYGTICYKDHSHSPIEVTLAYNNNIANPYTNLADFATLERDDAAVVANFFSVLFPGLVVLTSSVAPLLKTVTDFVLVMTGIVTYNDKTFDEFVVEYHNGTLDFTPASSSADWADMVSFNAPLLLDVFERLTGAGNSIFAEYLFADCFTGCEGVVSAISPGPVCGWTLVSNSVPGNATATFGDNELTFTTFTDTDFPGITKLLPNPLVSVNDLSGRYNFAEYPTPPNTNTAYQKWIINEDGSEVILISVFGDGSTLFSFGDPTNLPTYLGTWTPNNGEHTVHFTTGPMPTMLVDGVDTNLVFFGNIDVSGFQPPQNNSVAFFSGSGVNATASSETDNIFLVLINGIIGPHAILGCQG
jgi:hypothetical protein